MTAAKRYWSQRSDSERRTLLIGGAVLLLMFLVFAVWRPLARHLARVELEVAQNRSSLALIEKQLDGRKQGSALPAQNAESVGSIQALLDQALRAQNLQNGLKGLNTLENNRVQLEIHGVNFDQLALALEGLEKQHALQVSELSLEAKGSGFVNAKLVIAR